MAYLLPGTTAFLGIGMFSETVRVWIGTPATSSPTVGGFLYATLASLAVGLIADRVRRLTIDRLHHATGVRKRPWNYRVLAENLDAVEFVVSNQFRYHQFYGNLSMCAAFTYGVALLTEYTFAWGWSVAFIGLQAVLLMGSRDCLNNYYRRLEDVLGVEASQDDATNYAPAVSDAGEPKP